MMNFGLSIGQFLKIAISNQFPKMVLVVIINIEGRECYLFANCNHTSFRKGEVDIRASEIRNREEK